MGSAKLAEVRNDKFVEKPDSASQRRRYKRDVKQLFWYLESWKRALCGLSFKQEAWGKELARLSDFKVLFRQQWGFEALDEEVRAIHIRLAQRKMVEPIRSKRKEEKPAVVPALEVEHWQRRATRRKTKAGLRRHYFGFNPCRC